MNNSAPVATVHVVRVTVNGMSKPAYQCLTCGKTIKFWGTIWNHMAAHGLKVVRDI